MKHLFPLLILGLVPGTSAVRAEPSVDFAREVLPILSNKCFVCHGPDAKKDELRLDSREAAIVDLGGYRALDPEAPEKSEILVRLHDIEDPMPPEKAEKKLTEAERALLDRWVRQGGDYARHWAFVPPAKGKFAERSDAIDAWVHEKLAAEGIAPAPEADKPTLARRVALVLTGLPPKPEELAAFLADASPEAYANFVERLLAAPAYGEHQARYWLDAVRYGDTHGLHLDNRRGIFPYRDWVVKALNDNLPLDDFITYQLAGDLLPEPTLEQRVATGFVRMNPTTAEGGAITEEFQAKNNFDRTEMLGTVMLGMTLTCARCHTHKYDPISHTEYYELLAFFNSTTEGALDGNKYDYAPALKAPADQAGWKAWDALSRERTELLADVEDIDGDPATRLAKIADPKGTCAGQPVQVEAAALAQRFADLEKDFTTTLVAEELPTPRPTRLLDRGEYDLPVGEALEPAVPSAMGVMRKDTRRDRLGLAQWLTSRDNPLVARVLVNRIWQRTFGYGLVRTPEDFGLQGEQPTHPELLDWLAVELQESGWDLKHMLRLMVTSATFRQDARWRNDVEDPRNRLLARGPGHRLDAEVLRDIALWSSGLLDSHRGGEGVKPDQPPGLWEALAHPASNTKSYEADTDGRVFRRSLYVYWKRTSPHPMMTLFDAPSREASCVRRSRSTTPTQSLGLLNEKQRLQAANALAARLLRERDNDDARLDLLFTLVACRPPDAGERATCHTLLSDALGRYTAAPDDAAALLKAGDSSRGEGLIPAEHAAWAQLAAVVLASDAAILLY